MIFFCGDPHGEYGHIVEAVEEFRPQAIILLGDNTPRRPLEIELASILDRVEVWWIHGNHDTDSEEFYDNLFGSTLSHRNLHGRVAEVAGVRVAGLGGIFRTKIWNEDVEANSSPQEYLNSCGKGNHWRDGMPLRHRSTIFRSEVAALSKLSADVLVTHEAPDGYPFGSVVIGGLAKSMGVESAFHGHHHEDVDYPDCPWRGVGLRGIVSLDGAVIRLGET